MRRRDLAGWMVGALALLASPAAEARKKGSSSSTTTHRSRSRSSGSTYTAPSSTPASRSPSSTPASRSPATTTPAAQGNTPAGSPVQCTAIAPCTGPDGARYFRGADGALQFLR